MSNTKSMFSPWGILRNPNGTFQFPLLARLQSDLSDLPSALTGPNNDAYFAELTTAPTVFEELAIESNHQRKKRKKGEAESPEQLPSTAESDGVAITFPLFAIPLPFPTDHETLVFLGARFETFRLTLANLPLVYHQQYAGNTITYFFDQIVYDKIKGGHMLPRITYHSTAWYDVDRVQVRGRNTTGPRRT